MTGENIGFAAAFIAGLLSFFSPCILPLIPSYLSYITGISFKDLPESRSVRSSTLLHSASFIFGFSLVFVLLGSAANLLGSSLALYKDLIRIAGGLLIIFFGLFISGVFEIGLLSRYAKYDLPVKPKGYLGSFLVGIIFAAGWTPCVGPILGSILVLAGTAQTIWSGVILLAFYSLGLAVPFFLSSLFLNSFLSLFGSISKHIRLINIMSGIFLIVIGLLLITNYFEAVSRLFI